MKSHPGGRSPLRSGSAKGWLGQFVMSGPFFSGSGAGEEGIGSVVAGEFPGLGIELEVGVEELGDHAEIEDLGERSADAEGRFGFAIAHGGLHEAFHVVELRSFGVEGGFELVPLFGRDQLRWTGVGVAVDEVVFLFAVEKSSGTAEVGGLFIAEVFFIDLGGEVTAGFPDQMNGRFLVAAAGEIELNMRAEGKADLIVIGESFGRDLSGETELQIMVDKVDDVAAPVAEHSTAIEVEAAPIEGVEETVEVLHFLRPAPEVPGLKGFGNGLCFGVTFDAFFGIHEPESSAFPGFDFDDVINHSGGEHALELFRTAGGVTLVTHLGDDAEFFLTADEDFGFFEGVGQGLFDIDVLAKGHGLNGGGEVGVVGSGDGDGVDVIAHLVEHLAEVVEAFGIGMSLEHL